jgi:hypothetical protein
MKLYTEDQVKQMIEKSRETGLTAEFLILVNQGIELPTDKDTAHLQWIYDRMSDVHGENENYDYMLKFKEIIEQLKK